MSSRVWERGRMTVRPRPTGRNRRTLSKIETYPTPSELLEAIQKGKGHDYKTNVEFYLMRDRAFCCLLYLLALRISEGCRLVKSQFKIEKDVILVRGIKLSKVKKKGTARKKEYREEGWISLHGEREGFARLIMDYLSVAGEKLFISNTGQARKYVKELIGIPPHWLRAYGENYLYDHWEHDLLAVADYVKVDGRTLQLYIRKGYEKYKPV
jgi:integrase